MTVPGSPLASAEDHELVDARASENIENIPCSRVPLLRAAGGSDVAVQCIVALPAQPLAGLLHDETVVLFVTGSAEAGKPPPGFPGRLLHSTVRRGPDRMQVLARFQNLAMVPEEDAADMGRGAGSAGAAVRSCFDGGDGFLPDGGSSTETIRRLRNQDLRRSGRPARRVARCPASRSTS